MLFSSPGRRGRRVLGLSAAIALLGGYASGSAAEGPYPGLPEHTQFGSWAGATQSGITQTVKARQWGRVPINAMAVYAGQRYITPPSNSPLSNLFESTNYAYLVAPSGDEHNYGMSAPFSVRTVAFGAIPVEATVQLVQTRENGFPVPIIASATTEQYKTLPAGHTSPIHTNDTTIDAQIFLRVNRLVVDGVDLELAKRCQTVRAGSISLLGKGYWGDDPVDSAAPWKTGNYAPTTGGVLNGTVDIPAFGACSTASGEDVSRLLTATVSGPGNPVQLNVSDPSCFTPLPPPAAVNGPPAPGATSPEAAGCLAAKTPPDIPIP